MRGIIRGNTSQLAAGQSARSSVGTQAAAINASVKTGTSVARSLGGDRQVREPQKKS